MRLVLSYSRTFLGRYKRALSYKFYHIFLNKNFRTMLLSYLDKSVSNFFLFYVPRRVETLVAYYFPRELVANIFKGLENFLKAFSIETERLSGLNRMKTFNFLSSSQKWLGQTLGHFVNIRLFGNFFLSESSNSCLVFCFAREIFANNHASKVLKDSIQLFSFFF